MSTNAKAKPVVHAGTSILMKPRFSPGLLLRDDDLNQGVDYTRDLSRLLFRTLLGCGVVCGLRVTPEFKCQQLVVSVAEGVALDCHGDPIHVPTTQLIPIDGSCGQAIPDDMWVIIKRTEKCCAPRTASCSCDDEETPAVCTRERDGYEIRIVPQPPDCACGCTDKKTMELISAPPAAPAPVVPEVGGAAKSKGAKKTEVEVKTEAAHECCCVDSSRDCYKDYREGTCGCDCADCCCEWIVLAYVKRVPNTDDWKSHHSVRRFVRPLLMRDPVAWEEMHPPPKDK
jgi:hypothetical protein